MSRTLSLALLTLGSITPTVLNAFPTIPGPGNCEPLPDRMVVLGDSIVDCYGVGGGNDPRCSPYQLHGWLDETWAPGVTYENLSVSGATTGDVVTRQLRTVPTGEGHVVVVIFVGGNDLYPYLYLPEDVAVAAWPGLEEELTADWQEIFAFFKDTRNFPDGATIIINQQYNPFDDCYGTSQGKIDVLHAYNTMLQDLAASHDSWAADPYTPFLGHGHNYKRRNCPYYEPGADYWMGDIIHPNELGHEQLAFVWEDLLDPLYGACLSM